MQTGYLVDDESEDGADDERVCGTGNDVGDLFVDCFWRTSDSAGGQTVVDTVQTDDVVCTENAVKEKAPHASDTVLSEDIEGIIDTNPELDCEFISTQIQVAGNLITYSW